MCVGGGGGGWGGLKSERELQAVPSRLGNDIMRGLQRLAAALFIAAVKTNAQRLAVTGPACTCTCFLFFCCGVEADEGDFFWQKREARDEMEGERGQR